MKREWWPLLLPAAYALHLVEETTGGPGFVRWASEHLAPGFDQRRFVLINAVAWPAMLGATVLAIASARLRWLIVGVAVVLLINGVLHVGSTIVTGGYAPGVVTGALIYLPLGTFAVRRVAPGLARGEVRRAVATGGAAHAVVIVVAFLFGR